MMEQEVPQILPTHKDQIAQRLRPARPNENLFIRGLAVKSSQSKKKSSSEGQLGTWRAVLWPFSFFQTQKYQQQKFYAPQFYWPLRDSLLNVVLALWVLALIRLTFMDQGLIDYWKREKIIKNRQAELNFLINENTDTERLLQRMNTDRHYQKMLVNEYLGFIEKDEYLLIFQQDRELIPRQVSPPVTKSR